MKTVEILPSDKKIDGVVMVPGSKSYTIRSLVMAALSSGKNRLYNFSKSDDSRIVIDVLKKMGIEIKDRRHHLDITGNGGKFKMINKSFNFGKSGAAMRFMMSVCSLAPGKIVLDGDKSLRKRPIGGLVEALKDLGVKIEYLGKTGYPPIRIIRNADIQGGSVSIEGNISSQFVSSLLLIAPILKKGLKIKIIGEQASRSYVDMTIQGLKSFGVSVKNKNYHEYVIGKEQNYEAADYLIEGDCSGASYFWGIAAITGGKIRVKNINPDSVQGDIKFPDILREMGCIVRKNLREKWIEIEGPDDLKTLRNINMNSMPDTAQTMAVVSSFGNGVTKIKGLSTLRIKETDRLAALRKEFRKVGIKSAIGKDFIIVEGGKMNGKEIDTHEDHRMAMAFAMAGARIPDIRINDPGVISKSFPEFWDKLEELGIKIKKI